MRSIFVAAASALLLTTSLAQEVQSKPFNLAIVSDDESVNGTILNTCHIGAAIESLCTYQSATPTPFYVNYTENAVNASDSRGQLTWILRGGNFNSSQPMEFSYNPSSNVALAYFSPSYGILQIAFDDKNLLGVESYIDDTTDPATILSPPRVYYRWYLCVIYYSGYQYQDLAWVQGEGEPQNPSCKKVDVERRFI